MPPSRLDQVERISNNFNGSAAVALEKRAAQYQLTKEEHQERFALGKTLTNNVQQEKQSFNNPEEYQKRLDTKYAELADKHNVPKPENVPQGMGNRPIPQHQLLQMADAGVRQDHASRLKSFETDYNRGINNILDRAAQDGRGPQPQGRDQGQNRDQDNDRNRDRDRDN